MMPSRTAPSSSDLRAVAMLPPLFVARRASLLRKARGDSPALVGRLRRERLAALDREPGLGPVLLAPRVDRHVVVAHPCQLSGRDMRVLAIAVGAIDDDLGGL